MTIEREEKRIASLKGLAEKKDAIQDVISQLEKVESALLEKGAKTFKELYPDIEFVSPAQDDMNAKQAQIDYSLSFTFKGVSDLTSNRNDAYLKL